MDKKPNVIPTAQQMQTEAEKIKRIEQYELEKLQVSNEVYSSARNENDTPVGHLDATEAMRKRTMLQMEQREQEGVVVDPNLAENKKTANKFVDSNQQRNQEQIKLRDEQLRMNQEQTRKYHEQTMKYDNYSRENDAASNERRINLDEQKQRVEQDQKAQYYQETYKPPVNMEPIRNETRVDPYIQELSQPNYNAPFDVIPLPSKGKLYRNGKSHVKVAYLTTADENILSSPNLLESGEFLEILINRKILDGGLRYRDLLPGDRNAIMIWLRATGYGEMYPITILDEVGEPFDSEYNLNDLKTVELELEPNPNGYFTYEMKMSKAMVEFKLLTCGDIDDLEKMLEEDKKNNILVNNTNTYKMEKLIVSVNGSTDRRMIRDFVNSMRLGDGKDFNKYVESIECGIDLNITVEIPGGGSVATFLPLNINFFWPNV